MAACSKPVNRWMFFPSSVPTGPSYAVSIRRLGAKDGVGCCDLTRLNFMPNNQQPQGRTWSAQTEAHAAKAAGSHEILACNGGGMVIPKDHVAPFGAPA